MDSTFILAQVEPPVAPPAPTTPTAPEAPPTTVAPADQQAVTQAPGGTPPPNQPEPAPGWAEFLRSPMLPLLIGILILYLFVFRSKRQQDRKRKDMLTNLKKGDRVQTIGGILGTVVEARESEVLLKVDETSNTKMRFSRSAIHRVLDEEKAEAR